MQEGIKRSPSLVTKLRATFLKVTISFISKLNDTKKTTLF
jgi:hypothetical protein